MAKPLAVIKGLNANHAVAFTLFMTVRINSIRKESGLKNGSSKATQSGN